MIAPQVTIMTMIMEPVMENMQDLMLKMWKDIVTM